MIERRVACFPADVAPVPRLRGALKGTATLVLCAKYPELVAAIRDGEIGASIVVIDARSVESSVSVLRRLRADFATHALIAYCDFRELSTAQLLRIAQSGVTSMALRDVDDLHHVLGPLLLAAEQGTVTQVLIKRFASQVPGPIRPLFRHALEHASEPMSVADVSSALGVNRRTLAYRLNGYGFPSPRVFLTWCRLLVVGELLDERGRTLDSVAAQLDFSCGHTLGVVIQRYLGRGVAALRQGSVRDSVMAGFLTAINASPSAHEARGTSLPDVSAVGNNAKVIGQLLAGAAVKPTVADTGRT